MSTNKDKTKIMYYRQTCKGQQYSTKNFWNPGDPVKADDEEILKEVKAYYQKHGYPPCREDMPQEYVKQLKGRFRTWKNVMMAAGLPESNGAEAQRKRKEVAERGKFFS